MSSSSANAGWYAGFDVLALPPLGVRWPPVVKPRSRWKRITRPLRMRKARRLLDERIAARWFAWKPFAVPIVITGLEPR